MDSYLIGGIVIMVAVMTIIVLVMRHYQNIREETGYHKGKFYQLRQHMGAFIGNAHMNKIGSGEDFSDQRVDQDEEMFLFSDTDKKKTE